MVFEGSSTHQPTSKKLSEPLEGSLGFEVHRYKSTVLLFFQLLLDSDLLQRLPWLEDAVVWPPQLVGNFLHLLHQLDLSLTVIFYSLGHGLMVQSLPARLWQQLSGCCGTGTEG